MDHAECVSRIASTLEIPSSAVRVDRWSHNERRTAVHSWGTARGQRFFAKVLVADSFPRLVPIVLPTDGLDADRSKICTAAEQIATEKETAERFARLGGLDVPALLACDGGQRAIVWQEAPGRTLDALMRSSRLSDRPSRGLANGLQRAGLWIRRVHDQTSCGEADVNLLHLIEILERHERLVGPDKRGYISIAASLLGDAGRALGLDSIAVPITRTHGDLSPPNVLWLEPDCTGTVVDFEHSAVRAAIHDLVLLIANLRAKLLNPLVPRSYIERGEEAFWNGYGPIHGRMRLLVESLAAAWVFFRFLPALAGRAERLGGYRRLLTVLYKATFEQGRARMALDHMRRKNVVLR